MADRTGKFSPKTLAYLESVASQLHAESPQKIGERIARLVHDHDHWRSAECLNMNAAEGVMSQSARKLMNSNLATRVTEGFPGDKEFPSHRQNKYVDEIEAILISLATRLFGADYVEWRPISTSMANAITFSALTKPGDYLVSQRESDGGNYSYNVSPKLSGLRVVRLPMMGKTYEVDLKATRSTMKSIKPKLLVVGGSNVLFPYPLCELREIANEFDTKILFDAAHLGLLISAGEFPDPLAGGADVLTISTHKVMSGPVGGLIMTNDELIASKILRETFPAYLQTRDQNKYAATAITFAEHLLFGKEFAQKMVSNAKALADALQKLGFSVVGKERGFTQTHQVFVDLEGRDAVDFETNCQERNILLSKTFTIVDQEGVPGVGGLRLTTQELTRQGMGADEMKDIALFIKRAGIDHDNRDRVRSDILEFLKPYRGIRFSFDS